jgi:hypothetical protein
MKKNLNNYSGWFGRLFATVFAVFFMFGVAACDMANEDLGLGTKTEDETEDDITYDASANGESNTVTTTAITFTFSTAVADLSGDDIALANGTGTVTKGNLTGGGTSWSLEVVVQSPGDITVAIDKDGIESGAKVVTVHLEGEATPEQVTYSISVDGTADTTTSTAIAFTFGAAVPSLAAEDISVANDTGDITKGALTGDNTEWSLAITVNTAGNVKVTIIKPGIESEEKNVTVYKAPPAPAYTLKYLEVSQGFTAAVTPDVKEYRVKGIPYGKDTVTITDVSTAGVTESREITLDEEQTVQLGGGYTVVVPAKLTELPVPTEDDDVNINVTIAVRVIAPEGVLADKVYQNTHGEVSDNRSNGVHSFYIESDDGSGGWGGFFYTTNFPDMDSMAEGLAFEYDTPSGLWIYEAGTGLIPRNSLIRPYAFDIWDDFKESGSDGGFSYTRANNKGVLIEEEGDVYLSYTITLRKVITIAGRVAVGSGGAASSEGVYVGGPALYTQGPRTSVPNKGKGISTYKVYSLSYSTPAPYNTGTFSIKIESPETETQLYFIPSKVSNGYSSPGKAAFLDGTDQPLFAPFAVHNTDITDLVFTLESYE